MWVEVDVAEGVQADRERVLRGLDAEDRRARGDHPPAQHRRRGRAAGVLIERLEAEDQRRERV